MKEIYVVDKGIPAGKMRYLTEEELWRAQDKSTAEWEALYQELSPSEGLKQGSKGTGRRTALGFLSVATDIAGKEIIVYKADICFEVEDYKSLD